LIFTHDNVIYYQVTSVIHVHISHILSLISNMLKTTTNGPHFNFWVKLSFQSVVEFGLVKPNTIKLGEWVILFYCHVSNSFILLFDAAFLLRRTSGIFIVLAHWNNRLQLETDMWLSVFILKHTGMFLTISLLKKWCYNMSLLMYSICFR
jgi:hypothetical protein